MKNKTRIVRATIVALVALGLFTAWASAAYAIPEKTVKVNGKLFEGDYFVFARPDVPYAKPRIGNTIALEIKAKWVGSELVGSGSLHGINCHSTFFFDDLVGTIDNGELTLVGTVTSTSTPFAIWIYTPVKLVTDVSGENMHFIIADFFDFEGTGTVVR